MPYLVRMQALARWHNTCPLRSSMGSSCGVSSLPSSALSLTVASSAHAATSVEPDMPVVSHAVPSHSRGRAQGYLCHPGLVSQTPAAGANRPLGPFPRRTRRKQPQQACRRLPAVACAPHDGTHLPPGAALWPQTVAPRSCPALGSPALKTRPQSIHGGWRSTKAGGKDRGECRFCPPIRLTFGGYFARLGLP